MFRYCRAAFCHHTGSVSTGPSYLRGFSNVEYMDMGATLCTLVTVTWDCRTSTEIRMLCEVLDRMHQMDMPFKYTSTLSTPAPPHPAYDLRSAKERIVQAGTVIQTCSLPQASVRFPIDQNFVCNTRIVRSHHA